MAGKIFGLPVQSNSLPVGRVWSTISSLWSEYSQFVKLKLQMVIISNSGLIMAGKWKFQTKISDFI